MYIDLHCDTLWKMMENKEQRNLLHNYFSVDIEKLQKGNSLLQFFACFVPSAEIKDCYQYGLSMIHLMEEQEKKYKNSFSLVVSYEEARKNYEQGKVSGMLTVEDGGMLEGKLERLKKLYEKKIRLMTLVWNDENCIGYPNSRNAGLMQKGLKPFGFQVVERMNDLGMIIDVSHLSDGGFWDVMRSSKKPPIASHSNARTICHHPRNLSDKMIKALGNCGGIVGINFYHQFLSGRSEYLLQRLLDHIVHIRNLGGIEMIALGTDFDGITGPLVIEDSSKIEILWETLKKRGFSEGEIEKIQYKNAARYLEDVL